MSVLNNELSIRYVAIGDSFSEGVGDVDAARPNGVRGWADRVAEQFMLADSEALYANLAIRGRYSTKLLTSKFKRRLISNLTWSAFTAGATIFCAPALTSTT